MIVVDTHVLVWTSADGSELGAQARRQIQDAWSSGRVGASAMTFWEVALLVERQRIRLPVSTLVWRHDWMQAGLVEHPVDGEIGVRSVHLELPRRDPAGRIIAATASCHGATLVTADLRCWTGMAAQPSTPGRSRGWRRR